MASKKLKQYGRTTVNKLDILLAAVCVLIAIASLWISIGISIANAGKSAYLSFQDVWHAIGFCYCPQSIGIEILFTLFLYGGLILLICGCVYLSKKQKKDRIPGLVAAFLSIVAFVIFFALHFEYASGKAYGNVNQFWPLSLLVFVIVFFVAIFVLLILTFSEFDVELKSKKAKEEQPVIQQKEEKKAEEEVKEEAKEEEPEPEEEEEVEESEEESEEEGEESEGDEFDGFGKRRRVIPFENKLRKSGPETKERYNVIVNALREYDFNDRMSIKGETFSYKRNKLVFITFSGATLKVYFNLDPKEFEDSPLPIKDASDVKKYEQTPACLVIKSNLASRRAILLSERLAKENKVPSKK